MAGTKRSKRKSRRETSPKATIWLATSPLATNRMTVKKAEKPIVVRKAKPHQRTKKTAIPGYLTGVAQKEMSLPSVTTQESIQMLEKGEKPKKSKTGESFKGKNVVIISEGKQ